MDISGFQHQDHIMYAECMLSYDTMYGKTARIFKFFRELPLDVCVAIFRQVHSSIWLKLLFIAHYLLHEFYIVGHLSQSIGN